MAYYKIEADYNQFLFDTENYELYKDNEKIDCRNGTELQRSFFVLKILCEASSCGISSNSLEAKYKNCTNKKETATRLFNNLHTFMRMKGKKEEYSISDKKEKIYKLKKVVVLEKEDYELEKDRIMNADNRERITTHTLDLFEKYSKFSYVSSCISRTGLQEKISERFSNFNVLGLVGRDGSGKTTLALRYLYNQKKYKSFYFIDCSSISAFTKSLKIRDDYEDLYSISNTVIKTLLESECNFFIFDNIVFDEKNNLLEVIRKLIHRISKKAKVLYTSKTILDDYEYLVLTDLTDLEAKEYLKIPGIKYTDDDLDKILNRFGRFPQMLDTIKSIVRLKKSYALDVINYNESSLTSLLENLFTELDFYGSIGKVYKEILYICSMSAKSIKKTFLQEICFRRGVSQEIFEKALTEFNDLYFLRYIEENDEFFMYEGHQSMIYQTLDYNEKQMIFKCMIDIMQEDGLSWHYCFGINTIPKKYKDHVYALYQHQIFNKDSRFEEILLAMLIYYSRFEKRSNKEKNLNEVYELYLEHLNGSKSLFVRIFATCTELNLYTYISEKKQKELRVLLRKYENIVDDCTIFEEPIKALAFKTHLNYALAEIYWNRDDIKNCEEYVQKCVKYALEGKKTLSFLNYKDSFFYYSTHLIMANILLIRCKRGIAGDYVGAIELSKRMLTTLDVDQKKYQILTNKETLDYNYVKALLKNAYGVALFEEEKDVQSLKSSLVYNHEAYELYKEMGYISGQKNQLMNAVNIHIWIAKKTLDTIKESKGQDNLYKQYRKHLLISEYLFKLISNFIEKYNCEDKTFIVDYNMYQYYLYTAWLKESLPKDLLSNLKDIKISDDDVKYIPIELTASFEKENIFSNSFLNQCTAEKFYIYVLNEANKVLKEAMDHLNSDINEYTLKERNKHNYKEALLIRYRSVLYRMYIQFYNDRKITDISSVYESKSKYISKKYDNALEYCYREAYDDLNKSIKLCKETNRNKGIRNAYKELLCLIEICISNQIYKENDVGITGNELKDAYNKILEEAAPYIYKKIK